ncbi:hypothetical protein LQ564_17360 [Massilia sp. G4R7]|uniref:Uncharacterized protein n=1 Tax=Massilia phyllostachyos TaxID=2898585 RepID=A0ABS8Q8Q2_9BURK|nr:hypothetical protein [Massilia phyllostachyos]MCD2518080.1 hypothetical protein [Massilia phyllostachyos]
MHVEVPKSHSFKEFAGEYIMIVVSILTALALENGVHRYHQSHKAHEAARNLDAKIAVNIAEVHQEVLDNEAEMKRLKHLREVLLKDIQAGLGDKDTLNHVMRESTNRFDISFSAPTLQREAWDVAVANQALSYMPQDQLQRYAKVYARMRDMQATFQGMTNSFADLPAVADTMSNLELKEISPQALYRTFTQMTFVHESNLNNMRALEKVLREEQRHLKLAES